MFIRSLHKGLIVSFTISGLLLATSCKTKESCPVDEATKITTQQNATQAQKVTPEQQTLKDQERRTQMTNRTKTSSGLEYIIITPGDPNSVTPSKGKTVMVHYTGWLADAQGNPRMDKKFDSSVDRGKPFTFNIGLGMVIPGWDEGVMGMHKGEKRRLFIPSRLGYGAQGAGNVIPPNADLVFDVELINFQ